MSSPVNPFGARDRLALSDGPATFFRLEAIERAGVADIGRLPFCVRVLLEAVLRHVDGELITESDVESLARWGKDGGGAELPFKPARVLMQDFTGVPAVVDLAALRSSMARLGGDPRRINPLIPVDLVIDHSVQVDRFGSADAARFNAEREFERNHERYAFLRWGAAAFDGFRVVPPNTGIVHQVNLEYLAPVVQVRAASADRLVFPDSLVGTDSHTTMINALGVVGWGVGGIEAEAAMLGQPVFMLPPEVIGLRLEGRLPTGATATDLVLTVTEMLRRHGVVGKFVEFLGAGLSSLSLADRATVANMAPEYGATMGFFPVDAETLAFLKGTGRDPVLVDSVEKYCKEQALFRVDSAAVPDYTESLTLDLGTVRPSIAGPKRPQDRIVLAGAQTAFREALETVFHVSGEQASPAGAADRLRHGSVVIAAITSCTNTSNPGVMIGAGLLARNAVERGLSVAPHVKTSLAPGSRVVTRYLQASGLDVALGKLGFHLVGYGCTTCIGNSGPLPEQVARSIREDDLVAVSVLSGNRNFEGRISPAVRANYLASPPLVVAYAIAGTMDVDLDNDSLGTDRSGRPVYLADIWPSAEEVRQQIGESLQPEMYTAEYADVFSGSDAWNAIPEGGSDLYTWSADSTYVKEPPFFAAVGPEPEPIRSLEGLRVLAMLGDSVTTDHISPAGAIPRESPAGRYLVAQGVEPAAFNSFGSRRGNHEVMLRGTFGNIRIKNHLAPETEGGVTRHLPTGDVVSIYAAAMRYRDAGTPLIVLAGREYGTGSSRDWAAKGPMLLGVRAVLAASFERIHRSNLIGMGVLPLEFLPGQSAQQLGLTGEEEFAISIDDSVEPRQELQVEIKSADEAPREFAVRVRLDSLTEVRYYRNGGILQTVLRELRSP